MWPITIMVAGVCLLTAAVLIVILLIKRLRLAATGAARVGDDRTVDIEYMSKVMAKNSSSTVEIPEKELPSSDRLLRQKS